MALMAKSQDRDPDRWPLCRVIREGALAFECDRCWRLRYVDAIELAQRFGAQAEVRDMRARMKCRSCGSRKGRALVRLSGERKEAAWTPCPPRASR
jgi:hypothetical protein